MKRLMSCWYILLVYLCTKIIQKIEKQLAKFFTSAASRKCPAFSFFFRKLKLFYARIYCIILLFGKGKMRKKFCLLFLCFHLRRLLLLIYQRKYWMCVCLCVLAYVIEWLAVFSAYKILRPFLNACDSYTFTKSRL